MDELELRELSALFSLSRDAVLCVRRGTVVYANAAAEELFPGCTGCEAAQWLPDYIFEGEGESFVCTLPRSSGALSVSCVRRGDALLLSLPRSQRPRAVMPAAALGELRTTAYNLHMAAELMVGHSGGDEKLASYGSILQHNYYTLLRLTRNLTDANTLAAGELKLSRSTMDLKSVYRQLVDSVNFFVAERGVSIGFESKGCCLVDGDRGRLEQLLLNLLSNALLHTDRGDSIRVSLSRRDEQLILAVDDSGHGMAEAALSTLFTVRDDSLLQQSGAGLGLYVSQGIVQAHGGSILVESRSGKGTRIRVMLPAARNLTLRDSDGKAYGSGLILTELSPVLSHRSYDKRYRD